MYKILIVDDEMIFRKGIRMILQKSDFPIECITDAQDGERAMEVLEKDRYDIVITDIRMPRMDGLTLCGFIHQKGMELIVIILSGYDDFKYAQKAIQYGVSDYVLKPISQKNLLDVLKRAVAKREKQKAAFSYDEMDQMVSRLTEALQNQNREMYEKIGKEIEQSIKGDKESKRKILLDEIVENTARKTARLLEEKLEIGQSRGERFGKRLEELWKEVYEKKHYSVMEKIQRFLEEDPEITQEEICRRLGISPTYLSAVFKEKTGKKFIDLRTEIRMEIARKALCIPSKTVTQAAAEAGYSDYSHFSRIFKKYYGITPIQFREKRGISQ